MTKDARNIWTNPKILIVLLTAILLLGTTLPASGLKVSGVILQATAAPGDHANFKMDVSLGKNDTPMNLSLDTMDWMQSMRGDNNAVANNPGPYSAKDLLTVSPQSFHLEPNSSQSVAVEANIPADAKAGGRYAIVSIHSAPQKGPGKSMVSTQVAVNSLVAITVSGPDTKKAGEISNLTVNKPISAKQQNLSLIFNNTGNIHIKVLTEAVLKDIDGKALANASIPVTSNILPGAARLIEFSLKPESGLTEGNYTIDATVSLDDGTLLSTKSAQFEIKS